MSAAIRALSGRVAALWLAILTAGVMVAAPSPAAAKDLPPGCAAVPPPVRDLDIPRFYANAEGSSVDPELAKLHAKAVEPLVAFLRVIVDTADKAHGRRDQARASCALHWLGRWAEADGWLGDMVTRQAEYQRKWDLAGISLAYLKLRPYAAPEQRRVIEPWLQRWADKSRAFFDDRNRRRNNHWYWLGLGLMATGLATDSDAHWRAAKGIFEDALADIRSDGVLPLEMERAERGLFYHVFAMTPLVVMAEMAAARGEDWYRLRDGALHRLVGLCIKGLEDPGIFEKIAGRPQEQPVNARAGWLSLYKARFPDRVGSARLPEVPDKHRWLGGDVRKVIEAVAAMSKKS